MIIAPGSMSQRAGFDASRSARPVFARGNAMYIDGAAGSLILQMLAAGIIALGATLRSVRESVKRFFRGARSSRSSTGEE